MATSGRHMARFSARDCAIGPVRTVPIHPSSQTTRQDCACRVPSTAAIQNSLGIMYSYGRGVPQDAACPSGPNLASGTARTPRCASLCPKRHAGRSGGGPYTPASDAVRYRTRTPVARASRVHAQSREEYERVGVGDDVPGELGIRFPVGSSASRSGGSVTSARAIATRCYSPPWESARGGCSMRCPRPRCVSVLQTRVRVSRREAPATSSASATLS